MLIRRITISANNLVPEESVAEHKHYEQLDLFSDYSETETEREKEERKIQEAIIDIKQRYGKNSIIKGANLQKGATTIERNKSIGGHKA